MRQRLPDFLGDERHERMQQLEGVAHHIDQNLSGDLCFGSVFPQAGFCQLNIPVAENIPDKVVQLADCNAQLKLLKVIGDLFDQGVVLGQHPFVLDGKLIERQSQIHLLVLEVHQNKAGRVPNLVGKVAAGNDLLIAEAHIVARCVAGGKGEAQRICTVLVDDFQRVDTVAERFAHLSALGIANQTVEQNGVERDVAHVFQTGENHSGYPEEDDVIAGDQGAGRVEVFELLGVVWPTQSRERPQCRAEPGVQGVLILMQVGAAALRTAIRLLFCNDDLSAAFAVVRRDAMTPPQLTGDTPVFDVFHPVIVGLVHTLRDELDLSVADNVDCRFCQRLHLDEPLFGNHRFNGGSAAVAGSYIVGVVLHLQQIALLFQILHDGFSCLIALHACIFAAGSGHGSIIVHHLEDWQVVAASNLIVVRVVCRSDFYNAGTKFHIDIVITDNRNLTVDQRQDDGFANQLLVTFILRVNSNSGIAQHCFRAGGCQDDLSAAVAERVAQMPEVSCLLLIFNLCIRDGGHAVRAPVDDALALINQAFVVEVDKDLFDCLRASFIEGEAFSLPVAGRTKFFELLDDSAAVFALPFPCALQEAFSAQILLGQTLFLHCVYDLCLGCNGSVVGARQPEGLIALHPAEADEDVLQGFIQRVSHVQLTGDVRWRDYDGVRFFVRVWFSVKIAAVQPELIGAVLNLFRVVNLGKFFHGVSSLCICVFKNKCFGK